MSLVRKCDKCNGLIDTEGVLSRQSWVQAAVALDENVRDGGVVKDYHIECALSVTLAEVWQRSGLVPLENFVRKEAS